MILTKNQIIEVITTGAVVLSLLFVGYEIRQNSELARMQAYQNFQSSAREVALTLATDVDLSNLLAEVVAGAGVESFEDAEIFRISAYFIVGLRTWEEVHRAVEDGLIPDTRLSVVASGESAAYDSSVFRGLWESSLKASFDPGFVRYFESLPWF